MTDCKSLNTKNEQQKDMCITSEQLTEQWKKGELPEGWYYIEGNRAEGIYAYTAEYLNNMYRPRNGERIITKVPSYEQWQAKLEENTKLKELLKECREVVEFTKTIVNKHKWFDGVIAKINKALGEDK